jgi:hypothetical protein
MTGLDNGNGRKIAVNEAAIEYLAETIKAQTKLMNEIFGPNGTCPVKHEKLQDEIASLEKKTAIVKTQTSWQWGIITGIGGAVGYLFRLFIEHVQRI